VKLFYASQMEIISSLPEPTKHTSHTRTSGYCTNHKRR